MDRDPLARFHPASAAWFREAFPKGPTEIQRLAWPAIASGENVLLVSPTGTGKTLAALLVALDSILKRKLGGHAQAGLSAVYVSPLKALDADVDRNLVAPRLGIAQALAALEPYRPPTISIDAAVRTGDTPSRERAAFRRRPPDLLITTPESLYLLLTGAARSLFSGVTTVILDEVHSLAGTKRGAHLSLTLERLEGLVRSTSARALQRIALSATVRPIGETAAFSAGSHRPITSLEVTTAAAAKRLELSVVAPSPDLGDPRRLPDGSAWGPVIDTMAKEIGRRRTTLVFCNSRRLAERVAAMLAARLGFDVPTHHGSISRQRREELETRLKAGELPVLVATSSLELGIDIGHVDAVIQLESPKGAARGLQRVGRSGHFVGETARGMLLALHPEDLFEAAATAEAMREGAIEETHPPEFPLDVLAQQIVAEVVARAGNPAGGLTDGGVRSAELLALFREAWPYRNLKKRAFDDTVGMLSGKFPRERFGELAPRLVWDRATDVLMPLPGARLLAVLNGGTIPDRGVFKAVLADGKTVVGELDEEFVYESRKGDVFLLGSRAWRANDITHDRVLVEPAAGGAARMPFWRGEGPARPFDIGERIGMLKRFVADHAEDPALAGLLSARYAVDSNAAAALRRLVLVELSSDGLSTEKRVVFETFPNDVGDPCLVVRSLFGRAVNLPWSIVLAGALRDEIGVDVESMVTDDAILLRLPHGERDVPLARLAAITGQEARERLLRTLPGSPMFGARFRENAQRALLLPRARTPRRTPFWLQRLKAKDLLQTTRGLPDFPIVAETYRDCLRDLWEMERLLGLLDDFRDGRREVVLVKRKRPSPSALSILFRFVATYMYEWDAPRAEREVETLAASRRLIGDLLGEVLGGAEATRSEAHRRALPEATASSREAALRLTLETRPRTLAELLATFQEVGDLTAEEVAERTGPDPSRAFLQGLLEQGSVEEIALAGEHRYIAAEDRARYAALRDDGAGAHQDDRTALVDELVLRFTSTRGPATADEIAARFGVPQGRVAESLERLLTAGLAIRISGAANVGRPTFASARLYTAIERRTLAYLRDEIRPVSREAFRAFLVERHGIAPRGLDPRKGLESSLERALSLLRGLPRPVLSWEASILPARLPPATGDALAGALERLLTRGLLVYRASGARDPKSALLEFFFRGEGRHVLPEGPPELLALSDGARALYEELALSGASFLSEVGRGAPIGRLTDALTELVLAGLVTGDSLASLKTLLLMPEPRPRENAVIPNPLGRRPKSASLREARRRVAIKTSGEGSKAIRLEGRFSILETPGVLGGEPDAHESAEWWVRLLLARWGVVFRELVEREATAVRWGDLAPVFSRLELRGDVRRGEFVEGGGPVQYGEEATLEALRALARDSARERPIAVFGAADPLLLTLSQAPSAGEWLALRAGRVIARLSPQGDLLTDGAADSEVEDAFLTLQGLVRQGRDPRRRPRRLLVRTVDGKPATSSPLGPLLRRLGFDRDLGTYSWRAL